MGEWLVLVVATVPLIVAAIFAIIEVFRRPDLTAGRRVMWLVVILVFNVFGLAAYWLARLGREPPPITVGAGGGSIAELVVHAAERRQRGELDDATYAAEIDRLIGDTVSG